MVPPLAAAPDDAADEARLARYRRVIIAVLILVALGSLAIGAPSDHGIPAGERWFLLVGSVVFVVVVYAFGLRSAPTLRPPPCQPSLPQPRALLPGITPPSPVTPATGQRLRSSSSARSRPFSATAPAGERTRSACYAGPGLTWPGRRWRRRGFASRATCMTCSAIRCR